MGMMGLSVLASVTACTGMAMLVWIFQELRGSKLLGFGGAVKAEKVNKDGGKEPADMAGGAPEDQEVFTSYDEVHHNFESMGLQENLLKGIYTNGFKKPSTIQKMGIVPFCKGRDVIQQAQSGTGKTVTLCCGILQQLDYDLVKCQALVLAASSNSAHRIEKVLRALGKYLGVKVHACAGRTNIEDQHILQAGVHVVVGTPDGVFNMFLRRELCPDYIKIFVLDEADEVLTHTSARKIREIYMFLHLKVQIGVFAVRMPPEALKFTSSFVAKPVRILEKPDEPTLEGFNHFYVCVDNREESMFEALYQICDDVATTQTVIFVNTSSHPGNWLTEKMLRSREYAFNTRHVDRSSCFFSTSADMVKSLTAKMRSRGRRVPAISGNMDWHDRDIIMRESRSGSSRVLITTDVLAGCIDLQNVSVVVNYGLPDHAEIYLYRLGRSGGFERKGLAISIVTKKDEIMLNEIQRFYHVNIEELPQNYVYLL